MMLRHLSFFERDQNAGRSRIASRARIDESHLPPHLLPIEGLDELLGHTSGMWPEFRADQVCGSMKPRHLNCLAHFGDPPDGSIDVRESVYMYIYKEKIVREHLTGPQHYPDNGLVSGTRGEVSRNQEEVRLRVMLSCRAK
ncbi:hypothetical protein AVEN_189691-1 [Araneus ventricosus]|uniref:Uncharacterized protein n=1 Tax=Araneus ventricosus TaxID=182803 RepID=A0A4Y2NIR0_ARAVE|nr:hypothetical protein AVEN_189691-1 [Araneus ventricosus]